MSEGWIGSPAEKDVKGFGRRVEEKAGEEAGDERGGARPPARGMCDRELKEETSGAGTAAHDQTFVTETTASMTQPEPPTSLRAMTSSMDWPGMRFASFAPLP